jgi:hypothetical protein
VKFARLAPLVVLLGACDNDTSRFRPGPDDQPDGIDLFDTSGIDIYIDTESDVPGDGTPGVDTEDAEGSDATAVDIDTSPPRPTLADVHREVFAVACVQCHIDRVSGGLSLRDDDALLDRLLAPSVQLTTMARIDPQNPDGSYLWLKLIGDHEAAGGSGQRMPLSGAIDGNSLDLVERWIRTGTDLE